MQEKGRLAMLLVILSLTHQQASTTSKSSITVAAIAVAAIAAVAVMTRLSKPGNARATRGPTTSPPNVINLQTFLGEAPTTLQPLSRRACATQTESSLQGRRSAALRDVPFVKRVYKTSGGPVKDL